MKGFVRGVLIVVALMLFVATKPAKAQDLPMDHPVKFGKRFIDEMVHACPSSDAAFAFVRALVMADEEEAMRRYEDADCKTEVAEVMYVRPLKPRKGVSIGPFHIYEIKIWVGKKERSRYAITLRPPVGTGS